LPHGPWGGTTQKADTVYLHVVKWENDLLKLPAIGKRIVGSRVLTGGTATVRQATDSLEISVPKADRQEIDTIIALKLDLKP
jgi:alpha-L-fucosidase